MSSNRSFIRKIVYILAIGLLLIPLYLLSYPATNASKGVQGRPGGVLAQLRDKYHLSPAELGEIDPGSVTIKLATLGLRGVAANILWGKAIDYKMKKDWTNFRGTLNQITKVQPNFVNVWTNQAWNLSYNISVEFDDYRERYRWVIMGFKFLNEGIKYNDRQPRLLWEMGRMISQKIGKSDEAKQFRKLFKEDDDFNAGIPEAKRDNWLVGKGWYERATDMVDELHVPLIGQAPLIYRSGAPMCQMYYAEGVEKDGSFDEVAKRAWSDASNEWRRYGDKQIPTSFKKESTGEPIVIRLNDQEREEAEAKKAIADIEAIQPGLRKAMIAERKARLSENQRSALDTPPEKRTGKQAELAAQAEAAITVTYDDVARKIQGPKREIAKKLANSAAEHELLSRYIRGNRETVNFVYWREHSKVEQSEIVRNARKLIDQGDRAFADGDLVVAASAYRRGLDAWRKVLDTYAEYLNDQVAIEDLVDMLKRYQNILSHRGETLREPFILQDVLDAYQRQQGVPVPVPAPKKKPAKDSEKKPEEKPANAKTEDGKKGK